MILKALYGLHSRFGGRDGYSEERVSFALVLDRDGHIVDVQSLLDTSGKKPRPGRRSVPRARQRSSNVVSNFLWDNTKYVLGIEEDNSEDGWRVSSGRPHDAFKELHEKKLRDATDPSLVAVAGFVRTWDPDGFGKLPRKSDLPGANVVFRLDGANEFAHESDEAATLVRRWMREREGVEGVEGVCLVTGVRGKIEKTHPKVKGVRGAQPSGAALVSFNERAFESYGKKQALNAPVVEQVASGAIDSLNALLANSRRPIQIGDATTVFWAEAGTAAEEAEDLFSALLQPPSDTEEEAAVRDGLRQIAAGLPVERAFPGVAPDTRFFVLGLSPNAARLSVRFWMADTFGRLADRVGRHWQDLRLEPDPWRGRLPSVWRLLDLSAPPASREKKPQPVLAGGLLRAILCGSAYPASLMASILQRLRVERGAATDADQRKQFRQRVGIAKAFVARTRRRRHNGEEDTLVSLNRVSDDVAYNLGRLFGAMVYAAEAVAARSATLRDRYIGSASATPRVVFPHLMRNYEHNRSSLAKSDWPGRRVAVDKAVTEIVSRMPNGGPPATLSLEEQGRFFVGFHHQHDFFYTKHDSPKESTGGAAAEE